jgi:hypothetical protein
MKWENEEMSFIEISCVRLNVTNRSNSSQLKRRSKVEVFVGNRVVPVSRKRRAMVIDPTGYVQHDGRYMLCLVTPEIDPIDGRILLQIDQYKP